MMEKRYWYLWFLLWIVMTLSADAQQQKRHPFKVYGFIVYAGYTESGVKQPAPFSALQRYLSTFGIGKYDLLYEYKLLDFNNSDHHNGAVNVRRMDSLAARAANEPLVLVNLDLEGWNRFDTVKTPTRMLEAIAAFRKTNKQSPIGLYATVPQDTYGYPRDTAMYNQLNLAYREVAKAVNYYSPSLYNYKGADSLAWYQEAVYNINACRKYGHPDKLIIPYVSPEIWANGKTIFLTYDQMWFRLQTLYDLGVNGCLLWTSSKTRNADGSKVYLDKSSGWLKAVIDFVKINSNQ